MHNMGGKYRAPQGAEGPSLAAERVLPNRWARASAQATPSPAQVLPSATAPSLGSAQDGVNAVQARRLAAAAADVSLADWSVLLDAVKLRLRASVAGPSGPAGLAEPLQAGAASPAAPSPQLQRTVLECVDALDQLQSTLLHELARRLQLELQVFDAQVALAQARSELGARLGAAGAGAQAATPMAPLSGPDAFSRSRHQTLHDSLTDLPNRRFFLERLEHGLQHLPRPDSLLAVFSMSIDGYAAIEAEHGADLAQALLKVVAARWGRVLRVEDMLSRLDGAEFACLRLAQGEDPVALAGVSAKLVEALALPVSLAPLSLQLRVRIGMAQGGSGQGGALDLLARAVRARGRESES
ncbi:GGDEF domain-containing protein [Paucibacter sp. DJ1R-11]|uniref:GGDEF domain-containing protein n=1 Tax=Paucibacter sp. DJ1R-11 TaxID=2893556 RepID=UPI0021E420F8|nr:GGDEF domain-containing protein [Paucibacter sp. DJ1R-11]MCV2363879.1 GGDEF domain-containing protein [Paucibacter sp. DJ1R-11]